ncbi:hypothetical protein A2U01_0001827 [Trifolium medium]|uniref:Transmembrane protein n=1 Tax=Trifolium medium TaxID=97028 RepID=A0A392M1C8_9FABA|nr:hypothetical protein [Trifolium medium]
MISQVDSNEHNQRSITGNMISQLDNNEHNQHAREEIVRCISSFVVSTIISLGIFYNIWTSSLLSIIKVPLLIKERDAYIWMSLPGLFSFMVFVCAVAVMILVGAAFTRMQKAMLIFWVIMMHIQSANSIIEVFLTLSGGLFMVWYTFGKSKHQIT